MMTSSGSLLGAKPVEELPRNLVGDGYKAARKLGKAMLQKLIPTGEDMVIGSPYDFMHQSHMGSRKSLNKQQIRSVGEDRHNPPSTNIVGTTHSSRIHSNADEVGPPGDATRLAVPVSLHAKEAGSEFEQKLNSIPEITAKHNHNSIRRPDYRSISRSNRGTLGKQMLLAVRNPTLPIRSLSDSEPNDSATLRSAKTLEATQTALPLSDTLQLPRQARMSSTVSAKTAKPGLIVSHDQGSSGIPVDPRDKLIEELQFELAELERQKKAADLQLESLMTNHGGRELPAARMHVSGSSTSPYASALRAARRSQNTVTNTEREISNYSWMSVLGAAHGPKNGPLLSAASETISSSTKSNIRTRLKKATPDSPLPRNSDS
jgi:hypothetical protein